MESNNIWSSIESYTDDGYRVTQIIDLTPNRSNNVIENIAMENLYGDDTIYNIKHKICEYLKEDFTEFR